MAPGHETHHRILPAFLAVFFIGSFADSEARTVRYEVVAGSEVVFESKAPVESFQGKTTGVTGWFEADPDSLAGPVSLEILVDLASFDTGIGKRNQHMRENHLETGQFPNAVLRGGRVKAVRREGKLTVLTLESELDLHGIQRPVAYELSLQWRPDGALTVDTEFAVKLSDHQIKRPRFLVMKLADEQKVLVHLTARPMEGDALAE